MLDNNRQYGVYARNATTTATDVVIRNTQGRESDGAGGAGFNIREDATVQLTRALLENNRGAGVTATGQGATGILADVVVRRTRSREGVGTFGRGLAIQGGPTMTVTHAVVEDNREVGISGHGSDTTIMLTDVIVRRTQSRDNDGELGRGLNVRDGVTATLSRVLFDDNREIGVLAAASGTTVTSIDSVVRGTLPRACGETSCVDSGGGHGVGAIDEAHVSLTSFTIERSHLCGLLLARNGQVELMHGEVRGNAIGVCLQVAGYDPNRLASVRFADNGVNLQATELPVPEVTPAL